MRALGKVLFHIAHMVERAELLRQVEYGLKRNPVTAILGPRQCGKTTLARQIRRKVSSSVCAAPLPLKIFVMRPDGI